MSISISNGTISTAMGNYTSTSTVASTGQIIFSTPTGPISITDLYSDQMDFFELCLSALGYDIKFEDFKNLSKEQRKSLLRDIKLDRIL